MNTIQEQKYFNNSPFALFYLNEIGFFTTVLGQRLLCARKTSTFSSPLNKA